MVFVDSPKSLKVKPDPHEGIELSAEFFFRHVFGDKKYDHTAGRFNDTTYSKQQIKKMISKFKDDIDHLMASEAFIAGANHDLDRLESNLLQGKMTKEKLSNALAALHPIATFLGYGAGSKHKTAEPYFIPSAWQEMLGWNNSEEYFASSRLLQVEYRAQIARQLKEQGLTLAEIAIVLNQSGYRVAQLIKLSDSEKKDKKK